MQIVCTSVRAAAQVLTILFAAQLQPVRDYAIRPILSTTPPITFTLLGSLTATQVTEIRTIANATIIG